MLTPEVWEKFVLQFSECGLEVYRAMDRVTVPFATKECVDQKVKMSIMAEVEVIMDSFFRLVDIKDDASRNAALKRLTDIIKSTTDEVRSLVPK